jgi:hypothetical protein
MRADLDMVKAALVSSVRPWERSTGPRTQKGKARVSRNAYRGGQRKKDRALISAFNALMRD